eukprot:2824971-Rhodomonas_salina.2
MVQACMVESYVVQSPSLMPSSVLSARSGTGSALFNRGFPISRRSVTQETGLQNRGGVRGGGILELQCQQKGVEKGFNVLELTGALVPQGVLVKGVKTAWNQAWKTLMKVSQPSMGSPSSSPAPLPFSSPPLPPPPRPPLLHFLHLSSSSLLRISPSPLQSLAPQYNCHALPSYKPARHPAPKQTIPSRSSHRSPRTEATSGLLIPSTVT